MKSIVTLTGPSCAGKSTLERYLKGRGFASIISTTTRAPRAGEAHGKNYFFVTNEEFERDVAAGKFVEVVQFNGHRYGGSVAEFERRFAEGKPVVVVVEPNGRRQIEAYASEEGWRIIRVFVGGSRELVAQRFLARFVTDLSTLSCDTVASYAKRLATMMEVEETWREEARSDRNAYEVILEFFDRSNEATVVEVISSLVSLASPRLDPRAGQE